jgi:hypothetical protein
MPIAKRSIQARFSYTLSALDALIFCCSFYPQ